MQQKPQENFLPEERDDERTEMHKQRRESHSPSTTTPKENGMHEMAASAPFPGDMAAANQAPPQTQAPERPSGEARKQALLHRVKAAVDASATNAPLPHASEARASRDAQHPSHSHTLQQRSSPPHAPADMAPMHAHYSLQPQQHGAEARSSHAAREGDHHAANHTDGSIDGAWHSHIHTQQSASVQAWHAPEPLRSDLIMSSQHAGPADEDTLSRMAWQLQQQAQQKAAKNGLGQTHSAQIHRIPVNDAVNVARHSSETQTSPLAPPHAAPMHFSQQQQQQPAEASELFSSGPLSQSQRQALAHMHDAASNHHRPTGIHATMPAHLPSDTTSALLKAHRDGNMDVADDGNQRMHDGHIKASKGDARRGPGASPPAAGASADVISDSFYELRVTHLLLDDLLSQLPSRRIGDLDTKKVHLPSNMCPVLIVARSQLLATGSQAWSTARQHSS
jgi:hypothetical protein